MPHCSFQCRYDEQVYNGEVGEMEEHSDARAVDKGRLRDLTVVTVVRQGCCGPGSMSLLSRVERVVSSSLELVQTQHFIPTLNTLPSYKISLTLSNHRMSKMKNSSFSELDLLKRPSWSMLPPRGSMVNADVPGRIEGQGSYECHGLGSLLD